MFDKLWSKFVLQLNQKSPFFACLALFSKIVPDERIEIGVTAGRELRVNPDFLLSMTDEKAFSYLLHQVMHLALQHNSRRLGRDIELWNIAADIVVNEMIVEATQWPVAPMTAWDNRFSEQSVEQVYATLVAEQQSDDGPGANDPDSEATQGDDEDSATPAAADDNNEQDSTDDDVGGDSDDRSHSDDDDGSAGPDDTGDNTGTDSTNNASPALHPLAKLYDSRPDLVSDNNEQSQSELPDDVRHWNDAMVQAQTIATTRQQGKLPAALKREFERIAQSRVDWQRELWRFVSDRQSDFSEFDNRHIHRGLYIEELRVDGLELVVAIDTSGSVSSRELGIFMKELEAMQKLHHDMNISLYYCDAQAYGPHKLATKRPTTETPLGGAGTSFTPVFDAVNKRGLVEKPDCLIYFTDGYGDFPDAPPVYPVLWLLCNNGCEESDIPFGRTIRIPYRYQAM